MAQRVFTFHSPLGVEETIDSILRVVSVLRGTTVVTGNVITAKWKGRKYQTFFPVKFTFYIGEDSVRVVTKDYSGIFNEIKWEYSGVGSVLVWDDFVLTLTQMFPQLEFGLQEGRFHIVSAKVLSDGVEQSFYSTSVGQRGILGSTVNYSVGETRRVFSDGVLVIVRYSNGMVLEGMLSKKSKVYNRILVDLSKLSEE